MLFEWTEPLGNSVVSMTSTHNPVSLETASFVEFSKFTLGGNNRSVLHVNITLCKEQNCNNNCKDKKKKLCILKELL